MEEEEERRKSIDYGIPACENNDSDLSQGKNIPKRDSFVHFEDEESFPNYGEGFNDDGAIHMKTGLHNNLVLHESDPDILKQ